MNAHQRRKFTRATPKEGAAITFRHWDGKLLAGVVAYSHWDLMRPHIRTVLCGDTAWTVNIKTMAVRR